jgi:hypothetical protein
MPSSKSIASRQIIGLRDLDRKLNALSGVARGPILIESVEAAGKLVVDEATIRCPEEKVKAYLKKTYKGNRVWHPGFAKRNVRMNSFLSRDKKAAAVIIGVKREAFYAINFVELATSRGPGDPWLVPSFESTKDKQIDAFGGLLWDRLSNVARRHRNYG